MSPSTKICLLALVSTAAARPQYGYGNGHSKFHSLKPSGTQGYGYEHSHHGHGTGKPYPTGGYHHGQNQTAPYGTGSYDDSKTSTVEEYSTTTEYITKTVTVKKTTSAAGYQASEQVKAKEYSTQVVDGQYCGPATVTVTATAAPYTVTVPPNDSYKASSAPVEASSQVYSAAPPAPSKGYSAVPAPPAPAESYVAYSAQPQKPVEPAPSSSAEAYSVAPPAPSAQAVYSSAAPAPSAATQATGNTYSGVKRGLAYNDASLCKSLGGKYGFGYNWGQVENNDIGTSFVPMMHKPSDSTAEAWLANVDKAVKKGSTAVMGFNECDHPDQCNMTPEAACAAWKTYMNPIKAKYPQVTIVGPSVTNGPAEKGMGLSWLSKFHGACPDAIVDATNIHFYDIYQDKTTNPYSTTIDRFSAQVDKASKTFGKKVWVTEYGLNPGSASADQAATFLKDTMKFLDGADYVQSYAWFMVGGGEHDLHSGSGPSNMGALYASA